MTSNLSRIKEPELEKIDKRVLEAARTLESIGNDTPSAQHLSVACGLGRDGGRVIVSSLNRLCSAGLLRRRPSGRYELGSPVNGSALLQAIDRLQGRAR